MSSDPIRVKVAFGALWICSIGSLNARRFTICFVVCDEWLDRPRPSPISITFFYIPRVPSEFRLETTRSRRFTVNPVTSYGTGTRSTDVLGFSIGSDSVHKPRSLRWNACFNPLPRVRENTRSMYALTTVRQNQRRSYKNNDKSSMSLGNLWRYKRTKSQRNRSWNGIKKQVKKSSKSEFITT